MRSRKVPLLGHYDLLVSGASLQAVALAEAAGRAGGKVLLITPYTFLGDEMCVCQRPWAVYRPEDAAIWERWFPAEAARVPGKEAAFIPSRLKISLEDALLNAGVQLLYGTLPFLVDRQDAHYVVQLANKAGLQAVCAKTLADGSEEGLLRHLCDGTAMVPFRAECARRTIEFTGVDTSRLPDQIGPISFHCGAFDETHVLADIPVTPFSGAYTLEKYTQWNLSTQREALERVAPLMDLPAFHGARVGLGSLRPLQHSAFDPVQALQDGERSLSALQDGACFCVLTSRSASYTPPDPMGTEDTGFVSRAPFNRFRGLELIEVRDASLPLYSMDDVLVVGGGPAGAAAGISAAQEGASVRLVEKNDVLGGAGTIGGVHMYWFGLRCGMTRTVDRAVDVWIDRLKWPREDYAWSRRDIFPMELKKAAWSELADQSGCHVLTGAVCIGAFMEGSCVTGAAFAGPFGPFAIRARVTIDATGDGDLAVHAGANYVFGNHRDTMTMWCALAQFQRPARYTSTFTTSMDREDVWDVTRFILAGRRLKAVYDHAPYASPREARHIEGDVTLTLRDQLTQRHFSDVIQVAFSNHDPKGRSVADVVNFGILPPNALIEVPYRAFLPKDLEGILIAGRALSATHDAQAALRMQDDMQQQGAALGMAAAMAAHQHITPRQLNVAALQECLRARGMLECARAAAGASSHAEDFFTLVESLTGLEHTQWLDMDEFCYAETVSPVVKLFYADSDQVLPALRAAYESSDGPKRLLLARLLVRHGDTRGVACIAQAIRNMLDEAAPALLPRRKGSIRYCQLYPDHGVMAEPIYLLNALARAGGAQVESLFADLVSRIERTAERDYRDMRLTLFNYVDAVAYAAERSPSPAFAQLLKRLLALPEFIGARPFGEDVLDERIGYLRICLVRSLARCGSAEGYMQLIEALSDDRLVLAKTAWRELRLLTGCDLSGQPALWQAWLEQHQTHLTMQPWIDSMD